MDLNKFIKNKAKKNHIDLCGITDYKLEKDRIDWLYKRKKINYHTEFEEEDLDKRIDPSLTFRDAKSIIVIGMSYNYDVDAQFDYELKGNISKASWGRDYHYVLKDKMDLLIKDLKIDLDFKYKKYVDTGPLIDRELAYLSGLGFFGKNCSIINEKLGSFIFIGYIITDMDIENDEVVENGCGECDLCLKACPTGALEKEFTVNPKKCISYLTQTRDNIPEGLRSKMGMSIYGCDVCQNVCPKNKEVIKSSTKDFYPKITKGSIDIIELMNLSNREFKEKYGHMAGSWRGRNILKRNGIIALGNTKNEKYLNILEEQLKSESEMIVKYAKWAIDNIKNNI